MNLMDGLKENPVVAIIIICVFVASTTGGVVVKLYQIQIDNIVSKHEAEKARYETEIKELERKIKKLELGKEPNTPGLPFKTNSFELGDNGIYRFDFNKHCSLRVTEVGETEIKAEFNLPNGTKDETLQINTIKIYSVDGKEYNFTLMNILEGDNGRVAEFCVVIKTVN